MPTTLVGGPADGRTFESRGSARLLIIPEHNMGPGPQFLDHQYDSLTGAYLGIRTPYGPSRAPFPRIVPFPSVQRLLDLPARLKVRLSDALTAFRYGLPDNED